MNANIQYPAAVIFNVNNHKKMMIIGGSRRTDDDWNDVGMKIFDFTSNIWIYDIYRFKDCFM